MKQNHGVLLQVCVEFLIEIHTHTLTLDNYNNTFNVTVCIPLLLTVLHEAYLSFNNFISIAICGILYCYLYEEEKRSTLLTASTSQGGIGQSHPQVSSNDCLLGSF